MQLYGKHVDVNEHGEPINGDTLLILFNGDQKIDIPFELPAVRRAVRNGSDCSTPPIRKPTKRCLRSAKSIRCEACSVAILRAMVPEARAIPVLPAEALPALSRR